MTRDRCVDPQHIVTQGGNPRDYTGGHLREQHLASTGGQSVGHPGGTAVASNKGSSHGVRSGKPTGVGCHLWASSGAHVFRQVPKQGDCREFELKPTQVCTIGLGHTEA